MLKRIAFLALAVFVVLIAGGPQYAGQLPVRVIVHAALTLLFAVWLIARIRGGRFLPPTILNWPLYAGVGVIALSAAFSLDPRMAVEHAWWPLVHGLLFFIFAGEIQRGRQRWLFEALFLIGAITVLAAGVEFAGWLGRANEAVDFGALLRGTSEFPPVAPMLAKPLHASTALAGFVTPQIVVAFAWAFTSRQRRQRIALVALGVALSLVLVGTGSRGGFLALAAAGIVFVGLRIAPVFWSALRHGGGWGRALAGGAAAVLIAAAALGLVLYVGRSEARSSGDEIRLSLWAAAAAAAEHAPVLGVGTGLFGRAVRVYHDPAGPTDYVHRQAHNIVLNTAAEEGVAGLLILGWLAVALLLGWFRQRRGVSGGRAFRLDAVLAALAAVVVQAQFDVFFTTPFVGLVALLAAYAVVPAADPAAPRRARRADKVAAWVALALVMGYGVFWIPVDGAQGAFERSVRDRDAASAEQAAALDPGLHLYPLQMAYLTGLRAEDDPALLDDAIAGYEGALAREPAWETGWINLAGLYERDGRIADALAALDRARAINPASAAVWNWARIADVHAAAPDADIVAAYIHALWQSSAPSSETWTATPRRLQAVEAVFAEANPRLRYRLAETFFPERRAGLVPARPVTPDDWWIVGQHALTAGNDPAAAFTAFSEAVRLNPNREVGEYYAARARAGAALGAAGEAQARRDAVMASLLLTYQERPPAPYDADRNFEGVLYGRSADFRLSPALISPG